MEQSNIKLHQSDTREAQSLIVEAQHLMETQDTDPTLFAHAHHSLGTSYAMSRQFTKARASLETGLAVCANNSGLSRKAAKISSDLGTLMADNGNSRFAKIQFERTAQTNHDIGDDVGRIVALNNLVYAYFLLAQLPG
ncbi:MAG TPA: hypothetical protein DEW32_14385, partial [Dehalococcoidia bacterium]|nr:hypothetical protein [Dehalococcoidia bacterium]